MDNDLIERLARDSGLASGPYSWLIGAGEVEKFARLVVEECIRTIENLNGSLYSVPAIRERFGISYPDAKG